MTFANYNTAMLSSRKIRARGPLTTREVVYILCTLIVAYIWWHEPSDSRSLLQSSKLFSPLEFAENGQASQAVVNVRTEDGDDAAADSVAAYKPKADIGMVGMFYGSVPPIYERTMESQRLYAERYGYKIIMLKDKVMPRLWSKPAFVLATIIEELQKPLTERLEWLL